MISSSGLLPAEPGWESVWSVQSHLANPDMKNRCWFLVGLGRGDVKFQIRVVGFQRGLTGKPGRSLGVLINQHISELKQRHGVHKSTKCQRDLKFKAEMMRGVEGAVRAVQEGHQDYEKEASPGQRKKAGVPRWECEGAERCPRLVVSRTCYFLPLDFPPTPANLTPPIHRSCCRVFRTPLGRSSWPPNLTSLD